MISIKVPPLGESIVEATVSRGLKKKGEAVASGDTIVELDAHAVGALGDDDVFIIFDGPSANAIAASLVASAGGIGKISMVALLTAAEMDEAASKLPDYRAPGG